MLDGVIKDSLIAASRGKDVQTVRSEIEGSSKGSMFTDPELVAAYLVSMSRGESSGE